MFDPLIKFDEIIKNYSPEKSNLKVNSDLIEAYNGGMCGEEFKGKFKRTNKNFDIDLPISLVKSTKLRLENFGYKVLQNYEMSNNIKAHLFVPSL